MSGLTVAVLGGTGAMLGWGSADFFAKKTMDHVTELVTLFWGQLVGTVALAVLVTWTGSPGSFTVKGWLALAAFGLVSGGSYLLLYRGFARGQVSVLSPIFASYAGVAALVAAVAYHEPLPSLAKIAMPVMFIGVLLMATDVRDFRNSILGARSIGGVPDVVTAMLVTAGWLVLWDHFLQHRGWLLTTALMRLFSCLGLILFALVARRSLRVRDKRLWPYLGAIGLCDVVAYSAISYGFSHSTLGSVVALLSGAFSLPTMVLARIFLREHLAAVQGVAAAVILGGVVLVALG